MEIIFKVSDILNDFKLSHKNTFFKSLILKYNLKNFSDITAEFLYYIKTEDLNLYYRLIKILSLYDFHFEGPLSRYNIAVEAEDCFYTKQTTNLLDVLRNQKIYNVLNNFGFTDLESINGINMNKLRIMLYSYSSNDIINSLIDEISIYKHDNSEAADNSDCDAVDKITGKTIKLNEQYTVIGIEKLELKLDITDTSIKSIADSFHKDGILYVKDIPRDLDSYFSNIKGVGLGKKKRFLEYIEKYEPMVQLQSHVNYTNSTGEKVIKLDENYVLIQSEKLDLRFEITDTSIKSIGDIFLNDGILYIRDIPNDLDFYFSNIKGVGLGKKKKLLEYIENYKEITPVNYEEYIEDIPRKGFVKVNNRIMELSPHILELPIEFKYIPNNSLATALEAEGITYFRDLPYDLNSILLNSAGVGKKRLEEFEVWFQTMTVKNFDKELIVNRILKIFEDIHVLKESEILSTRDIEVLCYRFNNFKGGSRTLEEVSLLFNLTRERVRQIIRATIQNIQSVCYSFILSLKLELKQIKYLKENDYLIGTDIDFTEEFRYFLHVLLSEMDAAYKYDNKSKVFHMCDEDLLAQYNEQVNEAINQLFLENAAVKHEHIEEKVIEISNSIFGDNYPGALLINEKLFDKSILGTHFIFPKEARGELIYRVFAVYFSHGLALPKDYKQLLERILEEFPYMHDVYDAQDEKNERNITAIIQRKATLWGRGYYVPKGFSKVDLNDLREVIEWGKKHIEENELVEISLYLVFKQFESYLQKLGIENEHALYSAMKEIDTEVFYYRKTPFVRMKDAKNLIRFSQAETIENYISQFEAEVHRDKVKEYFTKELGWKPYTIDQKITQDCECILQYDDKHYIHADYVDIDGNRFSLIVNWLKRELLNFDEPIPITIVKKALLNQAKIHSHHLLYSLLKFYYQDEFEYSSYPFIGLNQDDNSQISRLSLLHQMENFLMRENKPVYLSTLKNEFKRRGWSEEQVSTRLTITKRIFPIEKGSIYVHADSIGITDDVIDTVSSFAYTYYKEELEPVGEFFVPVHSLLLKKLIENYDMPLLSLDEQWTPDLLSFALKHSDFFFTIGLREKVFFAQDNIYKIHDAVSLIEHILITKFNGRTTVVKLIKELKDLNIMAEKLFAHYSNDAGDENYPYVKDGAIIYIR